MLATVWGGSALVQPADARTLEKMQRLIEQQQVDGVDDHRFSSAGFDASNGQPVRKLNVQVIDDGKIAYTEFLKHIDDTEVDMLPEEKAGKNMAHARIFVKIHLLFFLHFAKDNLTRLSYGDTNSPQKNRQAFSEGRTPSFSVKKQFNGYLSKFQCSLLTGDRF